jgi:tripartite-type tricarboxylate transporter receptor subunit TctC
MFHAKDLRTRVVLAALAALGALATLAAPAFASDWKPDRPIRLIVPSTPGAGADTTARLFSDRLAQALGQPVIVDNKGGAGGLIGTEAAAKSLPDGYTLVLGSDYAFTIYPQMRKTPYDPAKDFEPVGLVANLPMVLAINPQRVAAGSAKELIALAKANPGKFTIASAGNGSSHHLAAEYFKHQAGVDLLHIPYKGAAEAMTAVLGGQADMLFISPATVLPHLKTGKVKAMGVSVARRSPALPDVPTLAEAGVTNYDIGIWFGFFYPARTPKPIIDRVNAELQKILEMPEVKARIADMGYAPAGGKPEALAQRMESDSLKFRKLVQDANIKPD